MKEIILRLGLLLMVLTLTSCASMRFEDFFSGYSQQLKQTRHAMLMADVDGALAALPKQDKAHNAYQLSLLEQARLNFVLAKWSVSEQLFSEAYQEVEKERAKAKIQISQGLENVGAVISNDSAIEYLLPTYEQSMLHSYQALNYVFQSDLQAALVEIRRANLVQEQALRDNQQEIDQAIEKMQAQGVAASSLYQAYGMMAPEIAELKNGFQNAYTFYLSGVLYEATGELNDAYIDYKKALEISPDNVFIQQDVMRLAQLLNMVDDLESFTENYGEFLEKSEPNSGELILFYEQGLIAAREETRLDLPISTRHRDMRFFSFSLPVYRNGIGVASPVTVSINGQGYQSSEVVRLQALAMKTLEQQFPSMVTRQLVRLLAKERLRRQMKQEGGDIGNVLASLYNLASERADTRSWQTLPQNIQIVRVRLPVGQHQLVLQGEHNSLIHDITINKQQITLAHMMSFGDFSDVQIKNL